MQNSQVYLPIGTPRIVNDSNNLSAYKNANTNEKKVQEFAGLSQIKDGQIYNLTTANNTLSKENNDLRQQLAQATNQDPSTINATGKKSSFCTIS